MSLDSLTRLGRFLERNIVTEVSLASVPRVLNDTVFQRLVMEEDLGAEFAEVSRRCVEDLLNEVRFLPYDPGHKLDRGEVFAMPLADLGDAAQGLANRVDLQNVDFFTAHPDFVRDLRFYTVIASEGESQAVFFRSYSKSRIMRNSKKFLAYFGDGVYEMAGEDSLLFDDKIDAILWEEHLFILNHFNFTRIFRIAEALQARIGEAVEQLTQRFPIQNADAFLEACAGQIQMMSKAVRIPDKAYFQGLTMHDIKSVIARHDLDLEITEANGREELVFDPSIERRWLILKVLDDDYLESEMTDLRYEVNSKLLH